jgi:hypothetical protein
MAILLGFVGVLDCSVAYLVPHPAIWCAVIPAIIPLMIPAVLFTPASLKRG